MATSNVNDLVARIVDRLEKLEEKMSTWEQFQGSLDCSLKELTDRMERRLTLACNLFQANIDEIKTAVVNAGSEANTKVPVVVIGSKEMKEKINETSVKDSGSCNSSSDVSESLKGEDSIDGSDIDGCRSRKKNVGKRKEGHSSEKARRKIVKKKNKTSKVMTDTEDDLSSHNTGNENIVGKQLTVRKPPKPDMFDFGTRYSFKTFMAQFEEYAGQTYTGSRNGWITGLSEFLTGHALRFFKAAIIDRKSYDAFKDEFYHWYKLYKISDRQEAVTNFNTVQMIKGELLMDYAVRLKSLANLAYPDNKEQVEKNLIDKFIGSIPNSVGIRLREYVAQTKLHHKKNVSYMEMMAVMMTFREAKEYDRGVMQHTSVINKEYDTRNVDASVCVVESGLDNSWTIVDGHKKAFTGAQSQIFNSRSEGNNRSRTLSNLWFDGQCYHCGKGGHKISDCYIKLGLCSYCKKKGHMANKCNNNPLNRNKCFRCGKKGHQMSQCWQKPIVMSSKGAKLHGSTRNINVHRDSTSSNKTKQRCQSEGNIPVVQSGN